MARKKSDAVAVSHEPADFSKPSRASTLIRKAFGDNVVTTGQDLVDSPREIISVSPAIDAGLHGGIVTGSFITLAGDAGCGKTTTALRMAVPWQKMGRRVYYLSAESRVYPETLSGVHGLDVGKIDIIQSAEGQIMTAEKYLQAAEMIINNERHAMIIIDSLSILTLSGEMAMADFDKSIPPGGSARIVGSFCRRMQPIIPIHNHILIGVAHVYANIGGKKKWAISLAQKALYARSTGMICDWVEYIQNDGERSAWGQKSHWTVERTPLGNPKSKVTSIIQYGVGVDVEYEAVEQGIDLGLVDKGGSWYTLSYEGNDPPQFQGVEKASNYLRENPESFDRLNKRIRELSFKGDE